MSFNNQTALITGGLGGIGSVLAQRLAADGARVVITDVAREAPSEVLDSLAGRGEYLTLDVTAEIG